MRKKLFRFFAAVFIVLLIVTVLLFTQLSYVGVKIQYFLIPALAITFLLSWFFHKENSDYFD